MFGIKRRFQRCTVWPPRFKESSLRAHQIWVPLENVRFLLLSTNLAREWLPIDRHRLAAYHNNHCWRAFPGYQHRWPWTTLNPKNRGFKWFICYFWLRRTLTVNFRWNIQELDQDNLRRAYDIKLMLWRVSWALAQISCHTHGTPFQIGHRPTIFWDTCNSL